MIPVQHGIEVDRNDSSAVQGSQSWKVVCLVQQWFFAPTTTIVPPAFGTCSQFCIEIGSLRLIERFRTSEYGLIVFNVSFRARRSVDADIETCDRMVFPCKGRFYGDGPVGAPKFEFGLLSNDSVSLVYCFTLEYAYFKQWQSPLQDGCIARGLDVCIDHLHRLKR